MKKVCIIYEEESGMRHLWELVNRFCPEEMATGIFLSVNIICWTVMALAVGMLFCVVAGHLPVDACIVNVMCMAIYAGIIFGVFGGILYLMRGQK